MEAGRRSRRLRGKTPRRARRGRSRAWWCAAAGGRPRRVTTGAGTWTYRFRACMIGAQGTASPARSAAVHASLAEGVGGASGAVPPGHLDGRLQEGSRCPAGGQGLGPVGFGHYADDVGLGGGVPALPATGPERRELCVRVDGRRALPGASGGRSPVHAGPIRPKPRLPLRQSRRSPVSSSAEASRYWSWCRCLRTSNLGSPVSSEG